MKDYYKILEVKNTSTSAEIKRAYRAMSKQYHPDVNSSSGAEDVFKSISEAYGVLGDPKKKEDYDLSRNPISNGGRHGTSFEDWVNNFSKEEFKGGFNNTGRHSSRRGGFNSERGTRMPTTDHLNIKEDREVDLRDLMQGTSVKVNYDRWTVDGSFKKDKLSKTLNIHLDLRKKHTTILKVGSVYFIKMKLEKLGHEDIFQRANIWGDPETVLLVGDYYLTLKINVPEDMELEDENVIQFIDIPLYKTLFEGEKIRITTLLDKSYDAEISTPKKLNDLKFNIKDQGIMSSAGILGNYIIRFNIIPPDLSEVNEDNLEIIKESFIQE